MADHLIQFQVLYIKYSIMKTKEKSTFDGLFVKNVLLKQSNFSNYVWILTVSLN
jgi:hypothetical protein